MTRVGEWLPPEALVQDAVFAPLRDVVDGWVLDWIGQPLLTLTQIIPINPSAAGAQDLKWSLRFGARSMGVCLEPRPARRLLAKVLRSPVDQVDLTPADMKVLQQVENDLLQDLTGRIEALLGRSGQALPAKAPSFPLQHGGVELILAEPSGGRILSIGLATSDVIRLRKSRLSGERRPQRPLRRFADALAGEFVEVNARVGRASLALADLRSLGVGDIIILDTGVEEPVEVIAGESEEVLGFARLAEENGQVVLSFY